MAKAWDFGSLSQNRIDHESIIACAFSHPFIISALAFVLLCAITRIKTGLESSVVSTSNSSRPRRPPTVSHWIPLIGHISPYFLPSQSWITSKGKACSSGIYSAIVAAKRLIIITSPDLQGQILEAKDSLSGNDYDFYVMKHLYGDRGESKTLESKGQLQSIQQATMNATKGDGMSKKMMNSLVKILEESTFNIVSGNSSWVDQSPWERSAGVQILPPAPNSSSNETIAEAYLHTIIRDWISDVMITVLMGRSLLENNQSFVENFWTFDSKYSLFAWGLPYWVVPTLPPAALKREHLIQSIQDHHEALGKILENKDPGSKYDYMDDVSDIVNDRVKAMRTAGCSTRYQGASGLALLWNANTIVCQMVFWLVYHILASPGLLQDIREEIASFVKVIQPPETGLPFKDPPKLKIDSQGLTNKCPLLKSVLYEALRLHNAQISFKTVTKDTVVNHSGVDLNKGGQKMAQQYTLRKGDMVCLPVKPHNSDSRHFALPNTFHPARFENEVGKVDTGVGDSDQTRILWRSESALSLGRVPAEQEILLFTASILTAYDVERADGKGWKQFLPQKAGAGVFVPRKDFRVKLKKRTK